MCRFFSCGTRNTESVFRAGGCPGVVNNIVKGVRPSPPKWPSSFFPQQFVFQVSSTMSDLVSEVVSGGVFQRSVSEVVSGARFPGPNKKNSHI